MYALPLVAYNTRANAFSVELAGGKVARTVEFDDSHLVDLDAEGDVLSIEILTPDDPKIEDMAAQFGFEDRVGEILEAIEAATPRITTRSYSGFTTVEGVARTAGGKVERIQSGSGIPTREIDLASS